MEKTNNDKYIRYLKSKHLIREVLINNKQNRGAWEELKKDIDNMFNTQGEWLK